jgi:hypothetical protein
MNKFFKNRATKELFYVAIFLSLLMPFVITESAQAVTSATVTITSAPAFVGISNAPNTWTINGITRSGYSKNDTTYYSNPLGDITIPANPVVDAACRFTITNTSTIATNITLNISDFSGGDASPNTNAGTNNATAFGAYGYATGMATYATDKKIAKTTGSDQFVTNLAGTTDKKWGIEIKTQANDWVSSTNMTATATITAISSE